MFKKNLLLLLGVVILAILPILFLQDAEFGGADGEAEEAITEIAADYEPWFSAIWEPPSGEIESLLFVLQGVIGALIIGYFIGYMRGKHTKDHAEH
ncbi:energy-coupling factor ABC transporter substrate-binding protein [Solibacillus sp. MA9]|uniref:Cobalt transport protein CbiN n=1 Tax=Solibacillus palustris TaxID=2908203 RepID=A0ABS9UC90_9BACL|nr:energy-coupling factor ABC transporter substrate-binding protein [Solibacillus sp. MA9]MCH7321956.1 energy-coupling factor ABC transporter substrate-binding protein [Solibacillus sp. MA9]